MPSGPFTCCRATALAPTLSPFARALDSRGQGGGKVALGLQTEGSGAGHVSSEAPSSLVGVGGGPAVWGSPGGLLREPLEIQDVKW